jgi:hypothetical protein
MELYDCEATRNVLEQHYQVRLKDFYELNKQSFSYDLTQVIQLQRADETLKQYMQVVDRQNEIIEQQQQLLAGIK